MRIYLDECADHDRLAALLRQAGHVVFTPRTEGTRGRSDERHLEHAASIQCVLLTLNPADFAQLHGQWQDQERRHPGIFLVYKDNDVRRDPSHADVVRAIGRLVGSGVPIANECHTLNHWR